MGYGEAQRMAADFMLYFADKRIDLSGRRCQHFGGICGAD
jgi:hypothetical protein